MTIEILTYKPTRSPHCYAFIDFRLDGIQFNGVNLRRDGTITGGMLTYFDREKRTKEKKLQVRPAVEIPQDHPLLAEIRAAVERHTAKMPAEKRMPPPWTPEQIEAKRQARLKLEAATAAKAARRAVAMKKHAASAPPARPRLASPPPAPPTVPQPRARIEPGKPLIQRPPIRRQG